MSKFDYGVFIGRFAPVHGYVADNCEDFPSNITGHVKVMMEALEQCDYLIVVVGSNNIAPNTRTPFTAEERAHMIRLATNNDPRIILASAGDHPYDDNLWAGGIQAAVEDAILEHTLAFPDFTYKGWRDYKYRIALAGMHKDETSYYLNMFPQWSNSIAIMPGTVEGEILSSTGIRNKLFNGELAYEKNIHPDVKRYIFELMEEESERWARLKSDWNYEQKYESLWGKGPHTTVDTIVIQAGHILLIQRGNEYGNGLWALPGGFVNRERVRNAAIRELREETKLKVVDKILYGSIQFAKVYDDPWRSLRSHIITHVHKIVLNNVGGLPEVMGADDAKKAKWVPISKLKELRGQFFEDHSHIIAEQLGLDDL